MKPALTAHSLQVPLAKLAVGQAKPAKRARAVKPTFDAKFGESFVSALPTSPGVYLVYGVADELIYVGKAINLRRRLSQYRNAKRRKVHHKMRAIVEGALKIEHRVCESHVAACLLENELIRSRRPRFNVDGAFHFLYPLVGLKEEGGIVKFCYTTSPDLYPGYRFHGAFRSRGVVGAAFFSLMELLEYIGHPIPWKKLLGDRRDRYTRVFGYRQLPAAWVETLEAFLRGESCAAIEDLVLALVENAGARRKKRAVQDLLNDLKRFWRHEAQPLARARGHAGHTAWPVPQLERDSLFVRLRYAATP